MNHHNFIVLDGGMGRELAKRNAPFRQPEWSALALMEAPETVLDVHLAYIQAGAQMITTNSYALVPFHIGSERFISQGRELAALSGKLARQAVTESQTQTLVAGSIPPLFGSYRADLFKAEEYNNIALPLIEGLSPHIDFWLAETQSALIEPQMLKPLLPKDNKPLWVSFTLQDEDLNLATQLRSGESIEDAIHAVIALDVATLLFNCSQPEVITEALKITQNVLQKLGNTTLKYGAYANAFPPQPKEATANDGLDEVRADLDPDAYLVWAKRWKKLGAMRIGGCCGIGPEHIEKIALTFK